MEHVEVSETGGHPVVYADWLHAAGKPTVLVYCHYDVQPVDPLDLWESPPFEPVVKDGRMLARGASDCKCHVSMHPRAIEALMRTRGALPVNLRFVIEGEEESSSIHLDAWLEANKDRLKADFAVISDTGFFEGNVPAITVGLRGLVYFQLDVTGSPIDLHSGVYGGAVDNPINALCAIVAALKGPDGRIRVPGFYDDVVELTRADREALARLPFDEEGYRRVARRCRRCIGEPGYTTLERLGARPTLDVCGIWGGFEGEGPKTIIPAHAHAKISCRLVADQDPEKIFEQIAGYIDAGRAEVRPVLHPAAGRRQAEPDADRRADDPGGCEGDQGHLRRRAALHSRGRLGAGLRQLRVDPRAVYGAARFRPAGRATSTPPTSGCRWPTTRPASGRSPDIWDEIAGLETL